MTISPDVFLYPHRLFSRKGISLPAVAVETARGVGVGLAASIAAASSSALRSSSSFNTLAPPALYVRPNTTAPNSSRQSVYP